MPAEIWLSTRMKTSYHDHVYNVYVHVAFKNLFIAANCLFCTFVKLHNAWSQMSCSQKCGGHGNSQTDMTTSPTQCRSCCLHATVTQTDLAKNVIMMKIKFMDMKDYSNFLSNKQKLSTRKAFKFIHNIFVDVVTKQGNLSLLFNILTKPLPIKTWTIKLIFCRVRKQRIEKIERFWCQEL